MRSLVILLAMFAAVAAFSPSSITRRVVVRSSSSSSPPPPTSPLNMGFGAPDPDQKKLTRENEPDDFFSTNTDKMTDEEKLPIAIAGLIGISLPFIAGLIALYAAK
jgi:hypothetical protein